VPVITATRPGFLHSSHKVWVEIQGSEFERKDEVRLAGKGATVLETHYESDTLLRVLFQVDDRETLLNPSTTVVSTEVKEEGEKKYEIVMRIVGAGQQSEPFSIPIELCPLPGMAVIPEGRFLYGSDAGSAVERPQRSLSLPAFACSLTEVSNLEYLEFLNYVQQTGDHSRCHPDEPPGHSHIPDRWDDATLRNPAAPVTCVDWFDAYAYAAWRGMRLPTEEEWEKAARGADGASFPWGEKIDPAMANTAETKLGLQVVTYKPEGRSPYGLYNAAGNVWEWTMGKGPAEGQMVVRGGSYRSNIAGCRSFVRNWLDREARRDDVGFRCVTDLPVKQE
jgi:formylglycine-generating enzyme required for sulfatase activity